MPEYSFDTPEPVDLRIRNATGTVTVTAADVATSTVDVRPVGDSGGARELAEETGVTLDQGRLTVEVPERRGWISGGKQRIAVTVTVPTGSSLTARCASAAVTSTGRFAATTVHSASGQVSLDRTDGPVDVNVASGEIAIAAAGRATVHGASGAIRIDRATGDIDVDSVSGRIRIGVAEASVRAKVVSGTITVDEASRGEVVVSATSGRVSVGVRRGVTARLDLTSMTGRVRSELPVEDTAPTGGAPLDVRARTLSGDILVAAATSAPSPA
jgi:DUF4097 and DUF4098 domain-containing protein YvlB